MLLLALFALVAGAATAVSPCVLPVLPALLAAGAAGGRRRPLGIVLGLAITFTVTIVGLAEVLHGVGLGNDATRDIAIAVLAAAGVALLVPALSARLEAPLSRLARFGPSSTGDGFWSGLGVGAALGFVYAPCAGPILAAVISVSAATGRTVVVAIAYAAGSAGVLLVLALGGRRALAPLRRGGRSAGLQRAIGAVMVLTAFAMAFQLDVRFEERIAADLPNWLVDPAHGLETSHAVQKRLADLRGKPRFEEDAQAANRPHKADPAAYLKDYGNAPDFTGTQRWFNTPGGRPLSLRQLRGRVVLIDFWTYTCINCIRTLPYLKAWDARYRSRGLTIVGVHSPEFSFEKDAGNVARAIKSDGLHYPVVQDNDLATWDAWGNQAWPAEYLIDARGHVRHVHLGEGEYDKTEAAIRALLAEAGRSHLGAMARPHDVTTPSQQTTPETYVGSERAERFVPATKPGRTTYTAIPAKGLPLSHFSLGGPWDVGPQAATAGANATLAANVQAKDVYIVLGPPQPPEHPHGTVGRVLVAVDGKPSRALAIRTQRLYTLAQFRRVGRHAITLRLSQGVSAYSFTFG
jgi:cytochrome c biogenesis protein CcdA/thiol-disulfide isomerase/thioredoxin